MQLPGHGSAYNYVVTTVSQAALLITLHACTVCIYIYTMYYNHSNRVTIPTTITVSPSAIAHASSPAVISPPTEGKPLIFIQCCYSITSSFINNFACMY